MDKFNSSTHLKRLVNHHVKKSSHNTKEKNTKNEPNTIIIDDNSYLNIYPEVNKDIEKGETLELYYLESNKCSSSVSIPKISLQQALKRESDSKLNKKLSNFSTKLKKKNSETIDENSKEHIIKEIENDEEKDSEFFTENEEEEYIIDDEFLEAISKNGNHGEKKLDEEMKIKTISKFIRNSKLMQKLENESDTKDDIITLSTNCAKQLSFTQIQKGNILFRIGDIGDRFYFILKGKVSILKPKKHTYYLTFQQYLNYCNYLHNNKEDYLLNKVLQSNYESFPILSIEDVLKINNVLFKQSLCDKINIEAITTNKQLLNYFKEYNQKYENFNLNQKELDILENRKMKSYTGILNTDWDEYIITKCKPTFTELMSFETYEELYKNNVRKNVELIKYDIFMYLGSGLFFGDFAMEKDVGERTATIRIEEDSTLAWLKAVDYVNMIAPKRRLEKKKETNFLNNNYFFKNINERIFEKNYFKLFTHREYTRDTILFNPDTKPGALILLKKGKISLTIKCSIIDLNTLLIYIVNKLVNISYLYDFKQKKYITKENMKLIKKYINDPVLKKLKTLNAKFVEELKKERIFQIAIVSNIEIIGLEEIYLKIPYITKAKVLNDKITCYELLLEPFNNLLEEEKENINDAFIRISCNKILSLIERIQSLKQNWIDIARMRSENENFYASQIRLLLDAAELNDENNENELIEESKDKNDEKLIYSQKFLINKSNKTVRLLSPVNTSVNINSNDLKKNNNIKSSIVNKAKDKISCDFKSSKNLRTCSNNRIITSLNKCVNINSKIRFLFMENKKKMEKEEVKDYKNKYIDNKFLKNHLKNKISQNFESPSRLSENNNESIDLFQFKKDKKKCDAVLIGDKCFVISELKKSLKEFYGDNSFEDIEDSKSDYLIKDKIQEKKNFTSPNVSNRCSNKFLIKTPPNRNINNELENKKSTVDNSKNINTITNMNYSSFVCNTTNSVLTDASTIKLKNDCLFKLPKIKFTEKFGKPLSLDYMDNQTTCSNFSKSVKIKKKRKEIIPEIVKGFYKQIKNEGCIPFISKKEYNTFFMRKFHKKYNKHGEVNKNYKNSNRIFKYKSLPKISEN